MGCSYIESSSAGGQDYWHLLRRQLWWNRYAYLSVMLFRENSCVNWQDRNLENCECGSFDCNFARNKRLSRSLDGYSSMRNEFWMMQLLSRNIGRTRCREASCSLFWFGNFARRHREKYWPLKTASTYGIGVISGQSWPKAFPCPHS